MKSKNFYSELLFIFVTTLMWCISIYAFAVFLFFCLEGFGFAGPGIWAGLLFIAPAALVLASIYSFLVSPLKYFIPRSKYGKRYGLWLCGAINAIFAPYCFIAIYILCTMPGAMCYI
ncbi:MAG: hypothetical protein IT558_01735 [Alphaproteobacteria bacterium]|nr:hypothetical protein [Alphaproteobacteria bacterium]